MRYFLHVLAMGGIVEPLPRMRPRPSVGDVFCVPASEIPYVYRNNGAYPLWFSFAVILFRRKTYCRSLLPDHLHKSYCGKLTKPHDLP